MSRPIRDISTQYYIQQSRQGFELKKARWYSRIVCFFTRRKYFSLSGAKSWQLALCADAISQKAFSDVERARALHQIVSSLSGVLDKGHSESVTNLITQIARHALPRADDTVTDETGNFYADVINKKIMAQSKYDEEGAALVLKTTLYDLLETNHEATSRIIPQLTEKFTNKLFREICWLAEGGRELMETVETIAAQPGSEKIVSTLYEFFEMVLATSKEDEERACYILNGGLQELFRITGEKAPQIIDFLAAKFTDKPLFQQICQIAGEIDISGDFAAKFCDLVETRPAVSHVLEEGALLSQFFKKIPLGSELIRLALLFPKIAQKEVAPFTKKDDILSQEILKGVDKAIDTIFASENPLVALEHYGDVSRCCETIFPAISRDLQRQLQEKQERIYENREQLFALCREIGERVVKKEMDLARAKSLIESARHLYAQEPEAIDMAVLKRFSEEISPTIEAMIEAFERDPDPAFVETIQKNLTDTMEALLSRERIARMFPSVRKEEDRLSTLCREIGDRLVQEKIDLIFAKRLVENIKCFFGRGSDLIENILLERFSEEVGPTIDAMVEALDQEGGDPLEEIRNRLMFKIREFIPRKKLENAFSSLRERVLVTEGRGERFIELAMERLPSTDIKKTRGPINQLFFHVKELVGGFRADPFVKRYAEAEIRRIDSESSLADKCERLHRFLDKIKASEYAYADFSHTTFINEAGTALRDCFNRIKSEDKGDLGEKLDSLLDTINRILPKERGGM